MLGRKGAQSEVIQPRNKVSNWLTDGSGRLSGGSRFELVKKRQSETVEYQDRRGQVSGKWV
jgi:hypothetical protein